MYLRTAQIHREAQWGQCLALDLGACSRLAGYRRPAGRSPRIPHAAPRPSGYRHPAATAWLPSAWCVLFAGMDNRERWHAAGGHAHRPVWVPHAQAGVPSGGGDGWWALSHAMGGVQRSWERERVEAASAGAAGCLRRKGCACRGRSRASRSRLAAAAAGGILGLAGPDPGCHPTTAARSAPQQAGGAGQTAGQAAQSCA